MDNETPGLGVGFTIDPEGSFETLRQIQAAMNTTEAKVVAEAAKIEKATSGMVNLGGATAQIATFGNSTSREMALVARDTNRAEKAGEQLVRQLNRQVETFGKTASEVRQMRAELRAAEAESRGLTELAGRIRATSAELDRLEAANDNFVRTGRRQSGVVAALIPQFNDLGVQFAMAAQSSNPLQMAMMAIIQQGTQIQQIGMQAGMGIGQMAKQTLLAAGSFVIASPAILGTVAAIVAGTIAFKGFAATLEQRAPVDDYIKTLGLTTEEAKKLTDTHVTLGDAAGATWDVIKEGLNLESVFSTLKGWVTDGAVWFYDQFKDATASVYAFFKAAYDNIGLLWKNLPALLGDAVAATVNEVMNAMQSLINDSIKKISWLAQKSNELFNTKFGDIAPVNFTKYKAQYSAAGKEFAASFGSSFEAAYKDAMGVFGRIEDGALANRNKRLSAQADEIIKDRKKKAEKAAKDEVDLAKWAAEQMQKAYGNVWKTVEEIRKRNLEGWGKGEPTWGEKDVSRANDADDLKQAGIDNMRDALSLYQAQLDVVSQQVDRAAAGMREAFGSVGQAIGDVAVVLDEYSNRQAMTAAETQMLLAQDVVDYKRLGQLQRQSARDQIGFYGDMATAAKGFFKEKSTGYKVMEAAEKAYRAVEFAMSIRAMAQNVAETLGIVANSATRATAEGTAGIAAQSKLPFPFNIAAMAATAGALIAAGVAIVGSLNGGSNNLPKSNTGTGTVLGDADAKSESIKRAVESLREVDVLMLNTSRQMAASLKSIEDQIGGFAALVLRTGDVNANSGISQGFKANAIGSVLGSIPLVGGILKGLFGTKTTVVGSGLYGGAQSLQDILGDGFDASYYSDVQKKKKFLGLTTSTKYSTNYSDADAGLENQFTLILREFNNAIVAAAGPLGSATDEIQRRLNGFVVNIGKIDLQGLTGEQIEEKLSAVFGKAADEMARAAFPGIERFQKAGEGLFETLVRVSSTVESVTATLGLLGSSAVSISTDLKMALAAQFDSVGDFTDAANSYFETYYTKQEQATARLAQFGDVFASLGVSMPTSLAGFRALVEAQNLNTAAGQATYATLLKLAPAFADLQAAMDGAKSAADIASERQDLQRRLLDLQGNTEAIRALDLANLDESNRALQQQIWALQDAKEAADAANQLRDAWMNVGDGIMQEVNRIRGVTEGSTVGGFATLQGQFNAATAAARGGDQDAAGKLVSLSQSLLNAAGLSATSKQELDRIKAQTAASLEQTYAIIKAMGGVAAVAKGSGSITEGGPASAFLSAAATAQAASPAATNDNMASELRALREEVAQLRRENMAGHAATAGNTGKIARTLDDVTADSGGQAISVSGAAA